MSLARVIVNLPQDVQCGYLNEDGWTLVILCYVLGLGPTFFLSVWTPFGCCLVEGNVDFGLGKLVGLEEAFNAFDFGAH